MTRGFSPRNLIGFGSFGSVYKGIVDQEEMIIAIKVLNLQQKGASKSFMAECNALRNIRHQNLVKILTCCSSMDYSGNEFKALVYEFMANGSLEKWLHRDLDKENQSRNLNLLQRLYIAIDVASALHYFHDYCERPIIHCDLKPSNVLLDDDMIAHERKRPIDKMFEDNFNLHNFVKMALSERLMQIVDPNLLTREVNEMSIPVENDRYKYHDRDDIEEEEEESHIENLS
ncbi:probable LRR receptor-like serine/threonine-protein kinase At3g47570 [Corylus avellana]|uniref:probable LRR receptor-like serine/threonine-protein kinase At3g47570 n=1 Tax=Corylus avellana TaxID=13451 RepID=UPI00286A310F|nr:probable LRR receptor-like serine/threonine-protein kinase At3g47570 [Corylus avellana]